MADIPKFAASALYTAFLLCSKDVFCVVCFSDNSVSIPVYRSDDIYFMNSSLNIIYETY